MNEIVLALMRLLAAASGRGPLAPSERAEAYLPTPAKLRAALSNATERQRVVSDRLAATRLRWNDLQAAGLIGKLDQARVLDAQMRTDPQAPKPIIGFPGAEIRFFHDKLLLDAAGPSANHLWRELIEGRSTLAAVTRSAAEAEEAVMHLRRLEDVLLRVQAARDAAQLTASPLHEVLALYRVEGDLAAPPSESDITDGIPSGTDDAGSSIDGPAMPDITHLVVLLHPGARLAGFIDLGIDADPEIRGAGLKYWFVQIAGLDVVGHQARDWRSNFAAWSSVNWAAAGLAPPPGADHRKAAEDRWDALVANMVLSSAAGTVSSAVQIAPTDPRLMLAGILAEAMMWLRQQGRIDQLLTVAAPPGRLSPGMSYLHYHAGTEGLRAILVRALLAVLQGQGLANLALRQEVQSDFVLASALANIEADVSTRSALSLDDQVRRLLSVWHLAEPWLATGARLHALGIFIETADRSWSSWREHRGNLSRYRQLVEYYRRLLA